MGKSLRNKVPETVSSKDDVLALMGGDQTPKQDTAKPEKTVSNKEDVMDLLGGTVKKKDTGGASSVISSPSPSTSPSIEQAAQAFQNKTLTPQDVNVLSGTDQGIKMGLHTMNDAAKDVFATAYNGPKKSDLVTSVNKIIDSNYPQTQDQANNDKRFQIKQSVLKGNQDSIISLKKNITDSIGKKIAEREKEIWRPVMYHPGAEQMQRSVLDQDPQIQQLRAQQKQVTDTLDEYGKMSLVSSNDMEPWLKLDSDHPNMQTSLAAEKLGKMVQDRYGLERSTPNAEHDRMKEGFGLIMKNLQMDINESLAYGIPSKNQELLKRAQDKLTTLSRYRDMYDRLDTEQFPDVGLDKTARFLGDIIAEKHPNKLIRTKEDVREAGNIADERQPGFLSKYGKFVDIAAEKQDQGTFIPRGGGKINELVGGAVKTAAESAIDLLKWRSNVFGYTKDKEELEGKEQSPGMKGTTQSRTETTKIIYDKEGKAYREMPNENYGTMPWNNAFRFIGSSVPGLLEFVGSEGTVAALSKVATAGKISKAASEFTGLLGATYLTSYNSNREFADSIIDDTSSTGEAKKIIAANFITLANAGVFHALNASPSKLVEKAISKSVMPDVVELFENNSWEQLNKKTAEGFLREKIIPRAEAVVKSFAETAGSGAKLGVASVTDQKVKDLVGLLTKSDYKPSTAEDNARAFAQQALLMTVVGLPGMLSSGLMPHTTRESLHQAGLYAPQYIDQINDRVAQGELEPKKANGMIAMVKTMGEEVKKAALLVNDDGNPLTTRQQRDIAIAGFRARAAAAMEESGVEVPTEKIGKESEKEVKDIRKENNWQNIEETPVFKSIKEAADGEASKGGKVSSMDEIDPTKQYSYEKDGETVTTDGATLINHLETGDIYEKAKPEDKIQKGDQTKDAQGKNKEPAQDKTEKTVGYSEPTSEQGKVAIKEANKRKKEVEDAGFDFLAQEDDGGFYDKDRQYSPDEVPIGSAGLKYQYHGKGLGTLGYILKGEEYLKQGRHLVSDAPRIPEARTDQAEGVWKKLVRLGLATETSPGSYRYGGERINDKREELKNAPIAPEDNIPVSEMIGKPGRYKGQRGMFQQDGQTVVFKVEGSNREYEMGNVDKIGGRSLKDYGIEQENSVVSANEAGNVVVRDKEYVNKYSDPLQAINYDKEGNIVSVNLETPEGKKRTFRGPVAEDVAYQIHLKEISDKNEQPELEKFINEDESTRKEVDDARLAAVASEEATGNPEEIQREKIEPTGEVTAETEESVPRGTIDNEGKAQVADKEAAALQGSYDRLVASGTDPNDPEMKSLKSRIESLSSPKTQTNGNVKSVESSDGQKEGSSQEGDQKSDQKGQEGDYVNPETDRGAVEQKAAAPNAENASSPIVGIRDSIVNADRVHRGLQPLVKEFVRSWGDNWNRLKQNIKKGFSPRKFIEDTALRIAKNATAKSSEKKRVAFSDYDYAALLFDRLDIQNNILRATDVLNEAMGKGTEEGLGEQTAAKDLIDLYNKQLAQNDEVGRKLKSESGRALSAIQMMTKMNGDLVRWSEDINHYYNGEVPEKIKQFVSRIENEYKEKNEQLRDYYEKELKKAAEEAFKKEQKLSSTTVPKKTVKEKGKELADKIRSLRPKGDGSASANLFGLPIAVYDTALVAIANAVEAGASLVSAVNEAIKGIDFNSEKDRRDFMAHIHNVDPDSETSKRASLIQDIKSIAKEKDVEGLAPESVKPLQQLMNGFVKEGSVKSLDDLVKKTYDELKGDLPDIEERDIRDAFSGYGLKPDAEGKLKSDLSKLREEARTVSQYQDLLKRPPGETPAQETKRLNKAADLYKDVEKYMREMGISEPPQPTTVEGRKALALDQTKSRMRSVIEGLNKQILAGERKERNGFTPDNELDVLRAERKRLSDQLDAIEKSKESPEQKIKQAEDALTRQISNYERQIKNGLDPMKPKAERPSSKQIDALRERKNDLKKEVDAMRVENDPSVDPKQKALTRYNEIQAKKIATLEKKIADKDFTREPEKQKQDFTRDKTSLDLETKLKKLQGDYFSLRRAAELANKSTSKKIMSLAAATKRAFVLSRIATFVRLGAAVAWGTIFEPAEAVSGVLTYGATKLGFARKLSSQADRYGISNLKELRAAGTGEGKALSTLFNPQTYKDFINDAKNGYSELSLMYDDQAHLDVPKELRDHWQNIEHGLGFFGRGHGAVKGIAKRMEFNRSYAIRKESLRSKGEDVDNPVIQASIASMAYKDGMRHILMEDNYLSNKYQGMIQELQRGGFGANALALTLQEMMPIVKIPTNLILNAGRGVLGTPLAGGVIAVRGLIELMTKGESKHGISKLTPEQSDALLRNLRKGNVGMALMLGGYFAPNMFGSSHYYEKGQEQPDGLKEGEVKFFGLTVPKWLADNPYLVTMKIGASLRSSFEHYTDEKNQSFSQGAMNAMLATGTSAMEETPILGTPAQALQALKGYGGNYFWYSQVKGTLEPGILQEAAEATDNKDNWYDIIGGTRIKRKPDDLGDALKAGLPGLRQTVNEK